MRGGNHVKKGIREKNEGPSKQHFVMHPSSFHLCIFHFPE